MRAVATRRFDFRSSRAWRAAIVTAHAATALLVATLALPPLLAGSLLLLVLALGLRAWRDADDACAGFVLRTDGSLVALMRSGRVVDGRLARGSVALPGYAAIAWRAEGERTVRSCAVPAGRLAADDARVLRVWLRYATSGEDAGVPASQARASTMAPLSALARPASRCR
jgi:hypothetical protein